MVIGLTNKEKKELKNVFDLFDTDHDGKITVKEISKVVHQLSLYHHTFARFCVTHFRDTLRQRIIMMIRSIDTLANFLCALFQTAFPIFPMIIEIMRHVTFISDA